MPEFAHVYVDNRCHLRCEHCYESEQTHPASSGLSLAEYQQVFEQLADLGVFVITFSGGEPFLRRDFLDIVALARRMRFAVRIYTSGTLLSPERVERLKQLKIQEVHVSVYSHDPDVHDAFTGRQGSHAKSLNGLILLANAGIRTIVKSNIMTINVDHIDELIALAQDVGADYRFDATVKPRMSGDTMPLRFAVSPAELSQKVLWRKDLNKGLTMEEAAGICDGENPRAGGGGGMCAAATGLIAIQADGAVSPCALYPANGGNALKQPIKEIWQDSSLFQAVRGQRFDDMDECPSCTVRGACHPCMAYAEVEHQNMRACNSSSRQLAEGIYLYAGKELPAAKKDKGRALPILAGNGNLQSA